MMPYLEILKPLAARGHKVTIVTDQPAVKWLVPSFPHYHIRCIPDAVLEGMHAELPQIMSKLMDPKAAQQGFAAILEHFTLPYYEILAATFRQIFTEDRPDILLCDFMADACHDMADTMGIRFGVTISGLPHGGEPGWQSSSSSHVITHILCWLVTCVFSKVDVAAFRHAHT